MKSYVHSGTLFISLNPAEHMAVTLPGGMLDTVHKSGQAKEDQFVFFVEEKGTLLRIGAGEYEILKRFPPRSPFDEELKKLVSEQFFGKTS